MKEQGKDFDPSKEPATKETIREIMDQCSSMFDAARNSKADGYLVREVEGSIVGELKLEGLGRENRDVNPIAYISKTHVVSKDISDGYQITFWQIGIREDVITNPKNPEQRFWLCVPRYTINSESLLAEIDEVCIYGFGYVGAYIPYAEAMGLVNNRYDINNRYDNIKQRIADFQQEGTVVRDGSLDMPPLIKPNEENARKLLGQIRDIKDIQKNAVYTGNMPKFIIEF